MGAMVQGMINPGKAAKKQAAASERARRQANVAQMAQANAVADADKQASAALASASRPAKGYRLLSALEGKRTLG